MKCGDGANTEASCVFRRLVVREFPVDSVQLGLRTVKFSFLLPSLPSIDVDAFFRCVNLRKRPATTVYESVVQNIHKCDPTEVNR